jgi:D-serine deaminase-like pyridoxal phosphate-dependent protein
MVKSTLIQFNWTMEQGDMKVTNYQGATIDPHSKGLGMVPGTSIQLTDAARLEWNLLNEDVSLPAAVLYADRVEHNLKWMQAFVAEYGVKLAPHGKTTMAPQLFRRQLENGAWGITLATAHQVRAAYHGGVSRVLMANQLVGRHNMMMVAELLSDSDFEFFCLVDSVEGVEQLGEFFKSVNKQLQVLLELGVPGGRTGVRDAAQRNAVLEAIARYPDTLKLAGVELYEGVLKEARRRHLSQGADGNFRAQSSREENGRRAASRAAIVGVCTVDSGTGSRDHRSRQARFRVRRRHAGTGAPLSSRQRSSA